MSVLEGPRREVRHVIKDGSEHWVDMRARALLGSDGRVAQLVGVSSDITARKRYELERERLLAEMAGERAALSHLTETLEQRVKERTEALLAEVAARERAQGSLAPAASL
jgi:ATP-dependent protease HslVU (ClpYQ) peptidase subunit